MPEEFHIDDLFERLILIEKVESEIASLRQGKGIPHEEVMTEMYHRIELRKDERYNA